MKNNIQKYIYSQVNESDAYNAALSSLRRLADHEYEYVCRFDEYHWKRIYECATNKTYARLLALLHPFEETFISSDFSKDTLDFERRISNIKNKREFVYAYKHHYREISSFLRGTDDLSYINRVYPSLMRREKSFLFYNNHVYFRCLNDIYVPQFDKLPFFSDTVFCYSFAELMNLLKQNNVILNTFDRSKIKHDFDMYQGVILKFN